MGWCQRQKECDQIKSVQSARGILENVHLKVGFEGRERWHFVHIRGTSSRLAKKNRHMVFYEKR